MHKIFGGNKICVIEAEKVRLGKKKNLIIIGVLRQMPQLMNPNGLVLHT